MKKKLEMNDFYSRELNYSFQSGLESATKIDVEKIWGKIIFDE